MLFKTFGHAWRWALVYTPYVIVIWEALRYIIFSERKKNPGLKNVRKRILRITFKAFIVTAIISLLTDWYSVVMHVFKFMTFWDHCFFMGLNLMCSAIIIGIYEGVYYLNEWQRSFAEAEELKKINIITQLDSLKGQINPHFLFNSLNTLSSLIMHEPERAERFVEEMSMVYRYLLKNNDQEAGLSRLRDELSFLQSYIHMLKTRFEEGLQVTIDIEEERLDEYIPSLVLQLLVENAVKHNVVAIKKPLHIKIATDKDGFLHVTNNLQKRFHSVLSEKKGLSNLIARYKLLNQPGLKIVETENEFKVHIPLMSMNAYESINN
jgi:LytS/YehU family sensor histidine kinase